MDPIVGGAIIGAGSGLLKGVGDMVSSSNQNDTNLLMQTRANEFNERQQQRAWQRDDTAVQRRVQDLRAAGLSPVLAAGSAAASSSPIQVNALHQEREANLGNALGEAVQGALAMSQMAKTNMDTYKTFMDIKKTGYEMKSDEFKNKLAAWMAPANKGVLNASAAKQFADARTAAVDANKAEDTGVTPSSASTSKLAADAVNFIKNSNIAKEVKNIVKDDYSKADGRTPGIFNLPSRQDW